MSKIEHAFVQGDYARTSELLEHHVLAAWYGISPTRFAQIAGTLMRSGPPLGEFMSVMSTFIARDDPSEVASDQAPQSDHPDPLPRSFEQIAAGAGKLFELRLQGRPVEALDLSRKLDGVAGLVLQPIFDTQRGLGLFAAVQNGITAMLAGDFRQALTSFTQSRMHASVPELSFLTRDASVKAAIIHALYGDPKRAESLLEEAEGTPRTESWAEAVVDVCRDIASAALLVEDPEGALRILLEIPLHEIGEMWPFYAEALHRSFLRAGRVGDARRKQEMFERMPLPRVEGQGYSGSILLLNAAQRAVMVGDVAAARERVARADGSMALTALHAAAVELIAGQPREALEKTLDSREPSEGLRLLNLQRLALTAAAMLALGARDDCREVIELVLETTADLTPWEALNFPASVRKFAEAEFEEWPRAEALTKLGFDAIPDPSAILTLRERELLLALVSGQSREQIAKSQFISINTLKSHLGSVYRKLGVNTRTGAVIEAERRGIS